MRRKEIERLKRAIKKQTLHSRSIIESKKKKCPHCGCLFVEDVKISSQICPHCDEEVEKEE